MPRRKSGAGRVTPSRRHKKDDDAPIHVSDREREVFQAEIGGRAERWAEEYADIVEQLPLELQRTFHLLRELDQRSETAKTDMDSVWKAYSCARAESSDEAQRYAHLMRLRDTSQQSISLAEEKLALALSAYDTVDRQIRRLDNDLLKNERSLYAGLRHELEGHDDTLQTPVPKETDRFSPAGQLLTFWSGLVSLDPLVCLAYLQEHMQKQAPEPSTPPTHALVPLDTIEADPSEPRYCYCDRFSYGDMVACDNDDCPREWFHIGCVGLDQPPKGTWYCQFCAPPHWKGPGQQIPPHAPHRPPPRAS
ncbi:chromatin modification-related protein [Malassezia restricta]|jgi:hypothetical protein|uniref:Chromatin modification-related protein n=1 Tax=Malassezia restricta (strain ATCC 96810 / NBRC 103918 / CBS 7877) TaxID=425264 RepID=A0A3G2SAK6_MALR7|nr:chromatin modification-related protein [Malassezia restricta]AXA52232.1 chromatin modification-related protein [Malassezia restricta]AYO44910.1 Inhibitor of growth protein 4 [Malassezia restricta CBS 7877]